MVLFFRHRSITLHTMNWVVVHRNITYTYHELGRGLRGLCMPTCTFVVGVTVVLRVGMATKQVKHFRQMPNKLC